MNRCAHLLAGLLLLVAGEDAVAARPCADILMFYIAVETAVEPLGLHGKTREQYLDHRHGAGRWRSDEADLVRFVSPGSFDAPIRVSIAAPEDAPRART